MRSPLCLAGVILVRRALEEASDTHPSGQKEVKELVALYAELSDRLRAGLDR